MTSVVSSRLAPAAVARLRLAFAWTRRPRAMMRRHVLLLAGLAGTLVVSASASGFWSGRGSGSASGSAPAPLVVAVSPGTPGGRLYPGGQADVALNIDNPNPFKVRVGSWSLDTSHGTGGFGVDAGHSGCALSALAFTTQSNGGSGWSVGPRVGSTDGALDVDLANALSMSTTAAGACQGATFTVYVVAGP